MASPEVRIEATRPTQDTTMGGDDSEVVAEAIEALEGAGEEGNDKAEAEETTPQMSFVEYVLARTPGTMAIEVPRLM